jgi:hypothetical protein
MKNIIIKISAMSVLICTLMVPTGCKKDYSDPNRATEEQVFSSSKGMTGVVVGLHRIYTLQRASSLYNNVTINGLLTNELIVVNTGNTAEVQLATGGTAVDGNHSMLTTFWTNNNKIIYDANKVITNAASLTDPNYASGLIAYATIFKALSLGNLSQFWSDVPASIGTNVEFVDRMEGFQMAIDAIDDALDAIAANPISPSFIANVPAGIDIINTLHALKARYSLFSGQYAQAIAEADMVNLNVKSTFNFDALSLNPIYEVATATNNVVQVTDSTLGLPPSIAPDLADKRIPFYVSINPTISPRYRIAGFGAAAATQFPVYLPGEMILIKAEAYARQSPPDLANALIELNKVVTKEPADDPFGVGADLPAIVGPLTQGEILELIYKHRSIELFMSGMKLEDMRRFGRPVSEMKRSLMPYPLRERDNNPNTPADPPF